MEKLLLLINEIKWDRLIEAVISDRRHNSIEVTKIKLRLVSIKGELFVQRTEYVDKKVLHENVSIESAKDYLYQKLSEEFKQAYIETSDCTYTVLISKKGQVTVKKKQNKIEKMPMLMHNRKKQYLLNEGTPVDFLVRLGVMNEDGYVIKSKYDKFKQINRFLEFVDDIVPKLPKDRELTIIDFGCGKSYLTFAIYYFLRKLKNMDVNIVGLDLKADVISHCNSLAKELGYEKLTFLMGDIADYNDKTNVDMVVTLHACDTATDYALYKAIKWGAKVILSVPCCQHEVNGQIKNELLSSVFQYGILKEKMAALMTDGIRANILEEWGYDTQILEFIDMEHTPKNLLIRAVKKNGVAYKENQKLTQMIEEFNIEPTLKKLMEE